MKKNDTLMAMLADYRPDLGDGEKYMQRLAKRLDAVDAAKRFCEEERRRQRSRLVVAFAAGGVAGALAALYLLLHPLAIAAPAVLPTWHIFDWLVRHADMMLSAITVVACAVGGAVAATQIHCALRHDFAA